MTHYDFTNLPVGRYVDALKAQRLEDDFDRVSATITAIYGLTPDDIDNLQLSEYADYVRAIRFLAGDMPKHRVANRYRLDQWQLVPMTDIGRWTTAQYIDFQDMAKAMPDMLVTMLSTLLVPSGHKYNDGYDMDALHRDIGNEMAVAEAVALLDFFLRRSVTTISRMLDSFGTDRTKREEMSKALQTLSRLGGGGWLMWMESLRPSESRGAL